VYWGHKFDLSRSPDIISHLIPRMPFPIGGPLEPSLTVSEIFNDDCDAITLHYIEIS